MKITYYVRLAGGVKTHVNSLLKYFNAKVLAPKIIYDYCNGFYVVDKGFDLIKKEMENCDIFHIHHPVATSEFLIPFIFKRMKKKPKIINTIHLAVGNSAYSFIQDTYVKLIAQFYKDVSSKIIVVGETQEKLIKDIAGDKVVVIPNGVDTKKYRKQTNKVKRIFKGFTVGYLGRLNMEKNIFSLVKACKRAGVNLAVAGTGPQYKKLKKMENETLKVLGFV
ncbi:MAG: glycosyltransferase family 4 protein, partial [Candidatus Aenigmarchaeota archaeon]|nr:glycosyltransferase family 4 protein [Candidatus Aenigmarchaeota archaeon]